MRHMFMMVHWCKLRHMFLVFFQILLWLSPTNTSHHHIHFSQIWRRMVTWIDSLYCHCKQIRQWELCIHLSQLNHHWTLLCGYKHLLLCSVEISIFWSKSSWIPIWQLGIEVLEVYIYLSMVYSSCHAAFHSTQGDRYRPIGTLILFMPQELK